MSSQQNLILTISGRHAAQFGNAAQKTFVQEGGSIGRADDCDWVLPASGVSRVHAMVRYLNGMYFIEDRSTNGMLLNGTPLTRGEPSMLSEADRLQVDSFEIEVRLQSIGAPGPQPAAVGEYNPDLTQVAFTPVARPADASAPVEDPFEHLWRGLGGAAEPAPQPAPAAAMASSPFVTDPLQGIGLGASAELDPLQLLSARPAPQVPATSDAAAWHHSPSTQDHFRLPSVQGSAAQLPEDWDVTDAGGPVAPAPATAREHDMLRGEEEKILAIVTEGVMEVLRARAEIKNSFRLPVTVIQRTENNPLKFAATPQDALHKIRGGDGAAFLLGAAAFDDAFDDIRCHQVAMLAGMRAGYDAVMHSFHPDLVQQDVDRQGGWLGLGKKGRYWERYRENYQQLTRDPDDCFRRLFGEEFARAYEAQLARYKSARRAETK